VCWSQAETQSVELEARCAALEAEAADARAAAADAGAALAASRAEAAAAADALRASSQGEAAQAAERAQQQCGHCCCLLVDMLDGRMARQLCMPTPPASTGAGTKWRFVGHCWGSAAKRLPHAMNASRCRVCC